VVVEVVEGGATRVGWRPGRGNGGVIGAAAASKRT
jgi:hypothetical protein